MTPPASGAGRASANDTYRLRVTPPTWVKSPTALIAPSAGLVASCRVPATPLACGDQSSRLPWPSIAASLPRGTEPSVQIPLVPLFVVVHARSKWPPTYVMPSSSAIAWASPSNTRVQRVAPPGVYAIARPPWPPSAA